MTRTKYAPRLPGGRWIWGWTLASAGAWAVATVVAFTGTWFLLEAVTGSADKQLDGDLVAGIGLTVAFAAGGAGIGAAQCLLLRNRLSGIRSWVWSTVLGWAAVAALYSLLLDRVPVPAGEVVHSLTGGALAGLLQVQILRANAVPGTRWWPVVSCGGFLLAAGISAAVAPLVGGDHSISAIAGISAMAALEGVVLSRLLRHSAPTTVQHVHDEHGVTL